MRKVGRHDETPKFPFSADDTATDPDASTVVDQPETPAHIFAVRAIRHAVVGTPKPKEQFTARQAAAQLVSETQRMYYLY